MSASLASFDKHVTEDAQADGGCKGRYRSRIFIVRSFGASAHGSTSAWPQIAICPN
jgi:hypothetical protein